MAFSAQKLRQSRGNKRAKAAHMIQGSRAGVYSDPQTATCTCKPGLEQCQGTPETENY